MLNKKLMAYLIFTSFCVGIVAGTVINRTFLATWSDERTKVEFVVDCKTNDGETVCKLDYDVVVDRGELE